MKNNHTPKYSLFTTLGTIIITIVISIMLVNASYTYFSKKNEIMASMEENSIDTIKSLEKNIINLIESYSVNEYTNIIFTEIEHEEHFAIVLEDYNMGKILGEGAYVVGNIRDSKREIITYDNKNAQHNKSLNECFYKKKSNIKSASGEILGTLSVYISDYHLKKELNDIIKSNLISAFTISLFLIISLFFSIQKRLVRPISNVINALGVTDKDGIPVGSIPYGGTKEIFTLSDTTNKMIKTIKGSRKSLNELNQRLNLVMEGVNDGIWDWDLQTNKTYFSKRWKSMLGYSEDELENNSDTFFKLLHEKDIKKVKKRLEKHLKDPEKNFFSIELRMRCKDGTYKWILTRGKASLDSNGNPVRMVGSHTDITDQKTAQKQIEEQKNELETIFNNSSDGIAILDLDTRFLVFNNAYLDITGFSKEELLQKSCMDLTIEEDREAAKKAIERVLKKGHINNFEKSCIVKGGKTITTNMTITLLPDKKRFLATVRDVTQLKLMESQAKLASMGEMIGNIAHQWRQPLSVISTGATGLKIQNENNILNDEILSETCDMINDNAQYLSHTIDDFRDFIKGDRKIKHFNLKQNIQGFTHLVEGSVKNHNINLILDLDEDIIIDSYPHELIQCFINIYNNSKDALNEKNIEDKLVFISTYQDDKNTVISFKDNAGGIPMDILPKIFEPYFTTKHQSKGTGLGLSMSYNIITQGMAGNLTAENLEYEYDGKKYIGAEFKISLPIN